MKNVRPQIKRFWSVKRDAETRRFEQSVVGGENSAILETLKIKQKGISAAFNERSIESRGKTFTLNLQCAPF